MVFYSQLIGKSIIDSNKKKVASVSDFCIVDGVRYASIVGIVIMHEGKKKIIDWRYVVEIGDRPEDPMPYCIYLNVPFEKIRFRENNFTYIRDIIDKQIMDISGARIVRVNDVLLGKINKKLAVVGISTSTRAIFRRLGIPIFNAEKGEHIIMWKDVAPLNKKIDNLQIKTKRERINQLHPAELADMIRDLSLEEKRMIFKNLDMDTAVKTILISQPDVQKNVFKTLSIKDIATMLEAMPSHDSAAILNMMPMVDNTRVLKLMKPGIAGKIRNFLKYEKRTAGSLMSTRYVTVHDDYTVKQVVNLFRKDELKPRHLIYIYVTDNDGILKGVVSFKRLLLAKQNEKIKDLIIKDIITVNPKADINDIFNLMSKYDLLILPVVDKDKKILGVIRMHDMFQLIVPKKIREQRISKDKKRLDKNGNSKT